MKLAESPLEKHMHEDVVRRLRTAVISLAPDVDTWLIRSVPTDTGALMSAFELVFEHQVIRVNVESRPREGG